MSNIRYGSLHVSRKPMSEARRQHVHGQIQPMDDGKADNKALYTCLCAWAFVALVIVMALA